MIFYKNKFTTKKCEFFITGNVLKYDKKYLYESMCLRQQISKNYFISRFINVN
ncbi:hypothetical protein NUSPORA_02324 [Nucleospora cyclopteri]